MREDGEQRTRRDEERGPDRQEELRQEAQRAEEHPAEQRDEDRRHARKDVDLDLRAGRGMDGVEDRPAAPDAHVVRGRPVEGLGPFPEGGNRGRHVPVELQHLQQVVAAVAFAGRIAVPERPPRGEVRLQGHRIVGPQQKRIVLHGEERRRGTEQPRSGGGGDFAEPAVQQQLPRSGRQKPGLPRPEELQKRLQVQRRPLVDIGAERVGDGLQAVRIGPLEEQPALPRQALRHVAQARVRVDRRERQEVGLDAQPLGDPHRQHTRRQREHQGEDGAQQPHRFSSISSRSPFRKSTVSVSGKPVGGTALTSFTKSFTSLISKIFAIASTSFFRRVVVVLPFTVIA